MKLGLMLFVGRFRLLLLPMIQRRLLLRACTGLPDHTALMMLRTTTNVYVPVLTASLDKKFLSAEIDRAARLLLVSLLSLVNTRASSEPSAMRLTAPLDKKCLSAEIDRGDRLLLVSLLSLMNTWVLIEPLAMRQHLHALCNRGVPMRDAHCVSTRCPEVLSANQSSLWREQGEGTLNVNPPC
eukprot:TRINITY_DN21039_c0_g1_i2.p3 TRINITY_DN21039_c0_g1~~TRINITY_DN21039_c0_g1_i2.p3  ORF type:complete len:183 (+),score=23.72 TRINITY_DN21039_c0_g1_i2:1136-1684(+)